MTDQYAAMLGEQVTTFLCCLAPIVVVIGIGWLAILGTYFHLGKLNKLMEEALGRKKKND